MAELYDVVDYFVLTEATQTHAGIEKPLFYKENEKLFQKYADKIIHRIVEFPETNDAWVRERCQRDSVNEYLATVCSDNDVVIISDADEIPQAEAVLQYMQDFTDKLVVLEQDTYYYYLNYKNIEMDEQYLNSKILPYKMLKTYTPCHIRYADKYNIVKYERISNAGWHFSFMGGTERIQDKLKAYAHQEYNEDKFTNLDRLKQVVDEGLDVHEKPSKWQIVEIDDSFPKLVRSNIAHFTKLGWIKKTIHKIQEEVSKCKKDQPVHVIIPTYNRHGSLIQLLSQIHKQTYRNVRVHVCSDGPDQVVARIVDNFNVDSDILYQYYHLDNHQGCWGAPCRRHILKQIPDTGFVVFVDDDNYIYPDYINNMYRKAVDGADLVVCKILYLNFPSTDGQGVLAEKVVPEKPAISQGDIDSLNTMVKTNIAKENIAKWSDIDYNHDFTFFNACAQNNNVIFIDEILGEHRDV